MIQNIVVKKSSYLKLKLLDETPRYDLYNSLTHPLKWKFFGIKTCICLHYLVLNFYQIEWGRWDSNLWSIGQQGSDIILKNHLNSIA
jgi:hypothetical protein